MKERIQIRLAWLVPRWLAYWCTIRVGAHATTGKYSRQVVPELTVADALKRWQVIALVALLLTSVGCIHKAKVETVAAPMELAWPAIAAQALDGGADSALVSDFEAALVARDFSTMRLSWEAVRAAADANIAQRLAGGEIGPGVAESLRERLLKFGEALAQIE